MVKIFLKQKSIYFAFFLILSILFLPDTVFAETVSSTGSISSGTTTVEFVNEYSVCDVIIKKVVTGTETEEDFEFTINISGLAAGMTIETSEGKMIADDDGNISETVTISAGESITIYRIPVGATYSVSEAATNYIASYIITNESDSGSIENKSASASSSEQALSTATETVDKGEEITITFTNRSLSLPSTGGIGRTVIFWLSAAGLITGFWISTKRKTKPL